MARLVSTIRPAPGADGPFFVVTENDGVVANVTTGVASINAALNQSRDDQGAIISANSLSFVRAALSTEAE